MKCLFVFFLLSLSLFANAQYDASKVNPKAAELYSKAQELAQNDDFPQAIETLQKAVKIDNQFEDAYLSIAGMYSELKNYQEAIRHYEIAKSIDSIYFIDYNLSYSISLAGIGQFEKALEVVNAFLSIPNLNRSSTYSGEYRKKCYEFAVAYAHTHPVKDYKFDPKNMGDSINTEVPEYYPTITIDANQLVFTRRVNDNNEDFYESTWKGDHWTKAIPLPGNINTSYNEGAQNISQDGQWLIFTGCNFPQGYGSCDLYISYLEKDGWSTPENLGKNVNTEFWESAPSLSPDKRDLYFASNRPGGYGGNDLYVCHLLPTGRWSLPQNLGPEINTSGNESTPFIHADNQSLYFTSSGHLGYGNNDLFVSRKDANGKWGKPENLGYPINTIGDEGSIVISADGKTAYYASDRADSRGKMDLYTFQLRKDIQPNRTLWIKGKVYDKKTGKGLPSAVELANLQTKLVTSKVQTDENGNYFITLPVGKDYAFNVNRKGYLFFSENFPLSKKQPDSTYNIDIPLEPIEANASVILKNIFFDINKYELESESQVELDQVVQLMKDNPNIKIEISGHTDNVGKPADNIKLSTNRAKSVVTYLTEKGVDPKRLSYKGFGDTKPIADNKTEEGRAQNRRTELKIVSN
ncbi:MAG: PD40 domain-containing protein [Bacteroidetes bacterium]|nr:PD40 domain-containing protein [Bacteroidota bacterium]